MKHTKIRSLFLLFITLFLSIAAIFCNNIKKSVNNNFAFEQSTSSNITNSTNSSYSNSDSLKIISDGNRIYPVIGVAGQSNYGWWAIDGDGRLYSYEDISLTVVNAPTSSFDYYSHCHTDIDKTNGHICFTWDNMIPNSKGMFLLECRLKDNEEVFDRTVIDVWPCDLAYTSYINKNTLNIPINKSGSFNADLKFTLHGKIISYKDISLSMDFSKQDPKYTNGIFLSKDHKTISWNKIDTVDEDVLSLILTFRYYDKVGKQSYIAYIPLTVRFFFDYYIKRTCNDCVWYYSNNDELKDVYVSSFLIFNETEVKVKSMDWDVTNYDKNIKCFFSNNNLFVTFTGRNFGAFRSKKAFVITVSFVDQQGNKYLKNTTIDINFLSYMTIAIPAYFVGSIILLLVISSVLYIIFIKLNQKNRLNFSKKNKGK